MLSGTHRNSLQEQVIYGRPAAEVVAGLAKSFGASRLMIATTASLAGADGLAETLARALGPLCVGVFSGVSAHSPREGVIAGAAQARRVAADLLVAVGGGSVIDATKVMQLALWAGVDNPEDLGRLRAGPGEDRIDASMLPVGVRMIAVPTTLSAAEFTPFAGVTDAGRHAKEGYAHRLLAPRAVVLDPVMTRSTPPRLWFSTGMKAVDHAVEQLCAAVRSPYADALAEAGLRTLAAGLSATRDRPDDLDARLDCQVGMWLAMSGAGAGQGLGASHAIGHTLGGTYGVPHGLTSCVILPAVVAWNAEAQPERQALVARLIGRPDLSASEAIKALARSLDLPVNLAAVGITPDQFQAIAEHTMGDRGVRANPRPITGPGDIVEILRLAAG